MAKHILLVNGPNLNLLGRREPDRYGSTMLKEIEDGLAQQALNAGARLASFQSNAEFEIVQRIQQADSEGIDFIVINPAAYTHTSVAIRDALAAVRIPFVEVHLSNIHAREPFRSHSYLSDIAVGVVSGLGAQGYALALAYALQQPSKV